MTRVRIPSDLTRVRADADTPYECFLCWKVAKSNIHIGKPWYEARSEPSGIHLRCCEVGKTMRDEDRDRVGDLWLDAQIAAGRSAAGKPCIGGNVAGKVIV